MAVHLSEQQIRAYRERSVSAAELLSVSEHLHGCEACRERMVSREELAATVTKIRVAFEAEAASAHISYQQIAAYVDGKIDESGRSHVEEHALECEVCAAALSEIKALQRELDSTDVIGKRRSRPWKVLWNWRALSLTGVACAALLIVLLRTPSHRNVTQTAHVTTKGSEAKSGTDAKPAIRDGTLVVSIFPTGEIKGLETVDEPDRAYIQKVLEQRRIDAPSSLANLSGRQGVLMGAAEKHPEVRLIAPLRSVSETRTPVFRWQQLPGATYRVSVFNVAYDAVAQSDWISAAQWQVTRPLQRGSVYTWQLKVRKDGKEFTVPAAPAPEARFQVLAADQETEIADARRRLGGSHLVLGVLYARAGLLDDAEREMQALREQNPDSELVAALLKSVQRSKPEPSTTKGAQ